MRKSILLEKMLFDAKQEMSAMKNANNTEEITGDSNSAQDGSLNSEILTGTEEDESKHRHDLLDNSEKWFLSAGKCVDDELFIFGKQCNFDHPSKSTAMKTMVLLPKRRLRMEATTIVLRTTHNYDLYKVFTPIEMDESRKFKSKPLPVLSKDIKKTNVTTSNEIRQKLGEISTFSGIMFSACHTHRQQRHFHLHI
ncbi:hypothetical protein [Parasitella parasitica]|uniref:Uncharacterized protein n=1 Tax=Parasitella parasitica TaxID=35722 RepID=A0A0B7N474_9FUNG|nr:hypothetical protein [Parasitella parasitica]